MPRVINSLGSADVFAPALRIQRSLAASVEKRVLTALAIRTPAWISPDHLTLLSFVSQCMVGVCYAFARRNPSLLLVGVLFLALNWLGDSLDGTLARVRNKQRPRYGFYVDHIADTIAAFFLMSGLAVSGYIHPTVAFGMLITFLMLSIESYLATYTLGTFRLSYWKFSPTEIRILLALGNAVALLRPTVRLIPTHPRFFDVSGVVAIAAMGTVLVVSVVRNTIALYRLERLECAG